MKCIGFGDTEGQCGKPAIHPKSGALWCDECNAKRIAHIDEQMRIIEEMIRRSNSPAWEKAKS